MHSEPSNNHNAVDKRPTPDTILNESNINEKQPRSILRHRKSNPEFRSSSSNIVVDDALTSPYSKSFPKRGLHRHKSSESFRDSFHDDAISLNSNTLRRYDSKSSLANSVKKWGSWYFKSSSNEAKDKMNSETSMKDLSVGINEPSHAPKAHKFPEEFLQSIEDNMKIDLQEQTPSVLSSKHESDLSTNTVNRTISSSSTLNTSESKLRGRTITKSLSNLSSKSQKTTDEYKVKNEDFQSEVVNQQLIPPSLDHIPPELATTNTLFTNIDSYDIPKLAPPPPMHNQKLTKRGSNSSLRSKKSTGNLIPVLNPSSSMLSHSALEPAITSNDDMYDIEDFLAETTAKFERQQFFEKYNSDQEQIQSTPSKSGINPMIQNDIFSDFSTSNNNLSMNHLSSKGDSSKKPLGSNLQKEPTTLSYRKLRPKKSQGFKFF